MDEDQHTRRERMLRLRREAIAALPWPQDFSQEAFEERVEAIAQIRARYPVEDEEAQD